MQVGDAASLVVTEALTLEAWIFPTGPGSHDPYVGIIVNREGEYEIARAADGTIIWWVAAPDPDLDWTSSGYFADLFQWVHIALVYDQASVRIYANGDVVSEFALTGNIGDLHPEMNDFRIGGRQGPWPQHFDGP